MSSSQEAITFLLWADTHFGYDQRFGPADFRWDIVRQMNHLAGWPYPEEIGGRVEPPAFAMHCGDMVDGTTDADRELALYRYFAARLRVPSYETLGNHDTAPPFLGYFRDKYSADSYSFDRAGFHFVSLSGLYDPAEVGTIPNAELEFLERDLATPEADRPVVVFTHTRLDQIVNGAEVVALLKPRRAILVASAHKHRPAVFFMDDILCVDIGHCRNHPIDPEAGRSLAVARIKDGALSVVPWRWDLKDWDKGQRQQHYPDIRRAAVVNRRY